MGDVKPNHDILLNLSCDLGKYLHETMGYGFKIIKIIQT